MTNSASSWTDSEATATRNGYLSFYDTFWTSADADAATQDGWNLFDTFGSAHESPELQRLDTPEEWETAPNPYPFADESDVWRHVTSRAKEGSALHQKALDILFEDNPEEYRRVVSEP